ncbi:MAG: hypothetical protein ABI787_10015 [Spartobacteria bacterium]
MRRTLALAGLGAIFCVLTLPPAFARALTPAEMIEKALPARKTMKSASKSEFLVAVCEVARKNRKTAAAITPVAIAARREYAGEIVGMILRCSGKLDCGFVVTIVAAAVGADGSTTEISDAAIARAPQCAEEIQVAARRGGAEAAGASKGPSPGEPGTRTEVEEKFDPLEPLALVCDDGTQRAIRQGEVTEFLRAHPGSSLGSCQPTPTASATPAAVARPQK